MFCIKFQLTVDLTVIESGIDLGYTLHQLNDWWNNKRYYCLCLIQLKEGLVL